MSKNEIATISMSELESVSGGTFKEGRQKALDGVSEMNAARKQAVELGTKAYNGAVDSSMAQSGASFGRAFEKAGNAIGRGWGWLTSGPSADRAFSGAYQGEINR